MSKKEISNISFTPYNERDEWRTNKQFYSLLNKEFNFDIDIAANKHNAKCKTFYSKEHSALEPGIDWFKYSKTKSLFLNPPFSLFDQFLSECNHQIKRVNEGRIVVIIRADSFETGWFRNNCVNPLDGKLKHEIRIYYPRIPYCKPNGQLAKNIGFPSGIVIFRPIRRTGIYWVNWKE